MPDIDYAAADEAAPDIKFGAEDAPAIQFGAEDAPASPSVAPAAPPVRPTSTGNQLDPSMMSPEAEAAAMFAPRPTSPVRQTTPEGWAGINKDLLPAGVWKAGDEFVSQMTPKALADARDVLALSASAGEGGITTDRMMELMGEPSRPPTTAEKAVAGGIQGVNATTVGLARFFNTPKGAATLGLGAVPAGAQRVAAAYFAYEMGSQFPEQTKQLSDAIDTGDPEKITRASAELGINALFVKSAATHGLTKGPPPAGVQAIDQMLRQPGEFQGGEIRFGEQPRPEVRTMTEPPEAEKLRALGLTHTADVLSGDARILELKPTTEQEVIPSGQKEKGQEVLKPDFQATITGSNEGKASEMPAEAGVSPAPAITSPSATQPAAAIPETTTTGERIPNALQIGQAESVHVQPTPTDSQTLAQGVRPPEGTAGVPASQAIEGQATVVPEKLKGLLTANDEYVKADEFGNDVINVDKSTMTIKKEWTREQAMAAIEAKRAEIAAAVAAGEPTAGGLSEADLKEIEATQAAQDAAEADAKPANYSKDAIKSPSIASPAPITEAAATKVAISTVDPRTLSDAELKSESDAMQSAAAPFYTQLEAIPEERLLTRGGQETPEYKAIHDQLKPYTNRREILDSELNRRQVEAQNKANIDARDKRVANAPVFQKRNGWEIIKDGVDYVLRDPNTKEDIYRGKLKRAREVADESKPTPPSPTVAETPTAEPAPVASAPAVASPEAKSKRVPKPGSVRDRAGEFLKLVIANAHKHEWVPESELDTLHAPLADKRNMGNAVPFDIATRKSYAKALQNAARSLGIEKPENMGNLTYRARYLDALKEFIARKDAFDEATRTDDPARIDIPVEDFSVGDTLQIAGKEAKVTKADRNAVWIQTEQFGEQRVPKTADLSVEGYTPVEKPIATPNPTPKSAGGELFADMPFNLAGEKQKFVPPTNEQTGYGTDTLTQNDLFAIADVTKAVDPFKSADAAQTLYGGATEAIARIQNQLRVMDSDPAVKRSFTKEQRARLKEVLNVLQERASKAELGAGGAKVTPAADRGIAASVRNKWTSATESPLGSEAGFFTLAPVKELWDKAMPGVRAAITAVREIYKENMALAKTSDYRRSILNWSAKLQRSFGEAASAQKEIETKIPNPVRRDAVSNWIEASGDPAVLQQRLAATLAWRDPATGKPHPQQKRLVAGYEAALNLTPEEIAVANDAKTAYDALGLRGQTYDVLNSFRDNYVTHRWNTKQGPTGGGGGSRMLKERFRYAKARTFDTFFDGEQAGYVPKTKDISKLIPVYLHEMNSVIAARQLVEQMAKGTASDGRPLLAARGRGMAVDDGTKKATIVLPDVPSKESKDYVRMNNQPALHDWRWASKDSAGNPVFINADLVVHPEAAAKLKNVLGRSAIREWMDSKTSSSAEIPKALARGIDFAQSETKRTMLGLLAPFHQVQEGTHAVGHRINPFSSIPKIDLVNDPAQMKAAQRGLMLAPDRTSAEQFMEGFMQSGLVTRIPLLGPLAAHYQNYLFHQYIPGLKFKTYEAIVDRNMKVYAKDLAAGKVSPEDVEILSAAQSNAAYGHLNYADLARNPTMLHLMRLGLLAPDFLEARLRFSGQGIKGLAGGKVGREQILALATLAVAQATTAFIGAQLTGGEWDKKDPFAFHVGNRKFTMRSVPEDTVRLLSDSRAFLYARLNPIIGKGTIQLLSGTDWRGQKVTSAQTLKELAVQPIPITLRPFVGTANSPLKNWEQLLGSAGIVIKPFSAQSEIRQKAQEWMANSSDPKLKAAAERYKKETFADSDYKPLREALINGDLKTAQDAYAKLLETREPDLIARTFHQSRPFTATLDSEPAFKASLSPKDLRLFAQAKAEQAELLKRFNAMPKPAGKGTPVSKALKTQSQLLKQLNR